MSNPLSRNGSATVQWVQWGNVIIMNFHVKTDGTLLASTYNGGWSTVATPVTGIQTDDMHKGGSSSQSQSAISAVSVNTGTASQEIHVFYPTYSAGTGQVIQSSILRVASNTWVPDAAFNAKRFIGNPRAAITWVDGNGVVQFRVYHVTFTSDGQKPLSIPCNVYEIIGTLNGGWQYANNGNPIIGPIIQNGGDFSDAVAALTWTSKNSNNQPEQQLRVYVYEGVWLQEYQYVANQGWVQGTKLAAGFRDQTKRYPVCAVQFVKSGVNNLRIYRNTYLPLGKNFTVEWGYDSSSEKWQTVELPSGIIHNTDGSMQSSAIAWNDPYDNSAIQLRLYQNKDKDGNGNGGIWIEENLYDTSGGKWVADTAQIDGVQDAKKS